MGALISDNEGCNYAIANIQHVSFWSQNTLEENRFKIHSEDNGDKSLNKILTLLYNYDNNNVDSTRYMKTFSLENLI